MSAPHRLERRPVDWTGLSIGGAALVVFLVGPGVSLAGGVIELARGLGAGSAAIQGTPGLGAGTWRLLGSTFAWAATIGVVGAVLACGAAWTMWRSGRAARLALLAPLLMPAYLAFAGWGLLRAPNTSVGAWLERAAQHGWPDAPVIAGKLLAGVGLALWSFPLGALVVWSSLKGTDPAVLDALSIDGAGRSRTGLELFKMHAGSVTRAVGLIALVMVGSAVPMHLAQVETLAIQVWFAIDNLPAAQHWKAWAAAWPLVLIAVCAGWWLGGRSLRLGAGEVAGASGRGGVVNLVPGAFAWLLGLAAPLAIFAANIGQASNLTRFWGLNRDAISRSAGTALAVGVSTLVLGIGTAWVWRRAGLLGRAGSLALRGLLITGLLPGVLIGSTFSNAVRVAGSVWLDDSLLPVIAAHVARFGMIGALAGAWGAGLTEKLTGDLARMDGADHGPGWVRAMLRPVASLHVAGAVAAGILSLHEIEATVQVMPPGDCLARVILGDLHYSRVADMSAGAVWLLAAGLLPLLAAGAIRLFRRHEPETWI